MLCGNDGGGSVGGGGGSGGRNAWGGRGLRVLGWGAKVRRLAMKVGALVRDRSPDSSRDAFKVEESRLRLWVREATAAGGGWLWTFFVLVCFLHIFNTIDTVNMFREIESV